MSASAEGNRKPKSWRERIRDMRTLGGTLDDFPPEEIPERLADAGHHAARQAAPLILAGGIAAGIATPSRAAETARPAAAEAVRTVAQMKLDTMIRDLAAHSHYEIRDINALTPADLTCLARNVFNEARGESFEGQLATVLVVLARAKDRRFPDTPCRVVYQEKQFSWTFDRKILAQQDSPAAGRAIQEIRGKLDALIGTNSLEEAIGMLGWLTGLPGTALFYKRTDWDHVNPSETRMSPRSKTMWSSLIEVKRIGHHTFYREPTKEERAVLRK